MARGPVAKAGNPSATLLTRLGEEQRKAAGKPALKQAKDGLNDSGPPNKTKPQTGMQKEVEIFAERLMGQQGGSKGNSMGGGKYKADRESGFKEGVARALEMLKKMHGGGSTNMNQPQSQLAITDFNQPHSQMTGLNQPQSQTMAL